MTEETLFAAALEMKDPAERAAFLDQACGGDAALRARLEVLLRSHELLGDSPKQTDTPAETGDHTPNPSEAVTVHESESRPPTERTNNLIGPYRLEEKLGAGGMGVVWRAEQQEPVKRPVALKVIKAGLDSAHVLARFEAERQALALMDHPNIARVFDAGSTAEGRPYFVMELVRGVPITRFCDQEQLSPRERLELFIPVCQAVQHAHQKGIIHRDLKPSNVLVARYDGKPVPKVIDFGIAKAIHQKLGEFTIATEVGQIVGTLEYMAPEQAELNNLDIDTRADVYSLGVLLYELLTGSPPFSSKQLRDIAFTEMLRTIREVEPPKPSTRLSGSQELPNIAAKRKLEPRRLTKLVRGELDWIVMKCLEKERSRRYETANDLALDIERYLADEPVLAGPPSAAYRLRKFVRRYKGPVLAAALVLLTLVGGITGTTLGLLEARKQRAAADESAATARQAETEVRAVLTFFQDKVLAAARPREQEGGLGVDASIQAAVDAAEPKIVVAFHDQPRVEAEVRHALGLTYLYLGQAKKAIAQYERAVQLRKEHLGPDHPETLASMNNLAWAYQDAGRLQDALPTAKETLERRRATLGPDREETLDSMYKLALIYHESGQAEDALSLYQETLQLSREKFGPDHPLTLTLLNALGLYYKQSGRFKDALPLYQEALDPRRATLGPDHPDTLLSLNNLAMAYKDSGRPQDAVPLLEEVWQRKKDRLGPNHRETITTMNNLAEAYQAVGRLKDALPLFEQALAQRKADLGPDHRLTLISMSDLVLAYRDAGRLPDAVKMGEETLKRRQATFGKEHLETLTSMNNLALVYEAAGRLKDAASLFAETLDLQIAKRGPDHPYVLYTMNSLARTYRDLGWLDDALPPAETATAKARTQFGAGDGRTLGFIENLAIIHGRRGQHDKAEPLLRESFAIRQKTQPDAWTTFLAQSSLGACLLAQKKYADAEPLLVQGYEGMNKRADKIQPPGKVRLRDALQRLVQLYDAWGKKDKAEPWRKKLETMKRPAGLSKDAKPR
jgi:serine/threonine protein kinase/tetratricopeptide (TPR) repeat protein